MGILHNGETLMQRRRVEEEGLRIVNSCCWEDNDGTQQGKVTANYVPAAAVKRRSQALSGITGCKGERRREDKLEVKSMGSTHKLLSKLFFLE